MDESATTNVAQLVGTQDGEVVVPTYDWTTMFAGHFRKLNNFKQYQHFTFQHFTFQATTPGIVSLRVASDSKEETVSLLSDSDWCPVASCLPQRVIPAGLSR